uniref:Uncharacterized protein n=1 Tax=Panagrolaimus sp. PS1159 TaxID=55785 RepID=A0AC35FMF5_9BILA
MNYYIFNRPVFDKYFNCSFYDVEKVPLEKRQDFWFGLFLITCFVVFELLYIPSILVIRQPRFQKESCFKIMYIMAFVDMIALIVCAGITGYFFIIGAVYCTCPKLMLIFSVIGFGSWVIESDFAVILAINRCLIIGSPRLGEILFKNKRVYFWICFPFLHASIAMLYGNGIMFSSIGGAWFFNPHFGYANVKDFDYHNPFQTIQNIGVVLVLTLVYGIFGITLTRKSCQHSSNATVVSCILNKAPIFTQVGIISFINLASALAYYFMQFFTIPLEAAKIVTFSWVLIH